MSRSYVVVLDVDLRQVIACAPQLQQRNPGVVSLQGHPSLKMVFFNLACSPVEPSTQYLHDIAWRMFHATQQPREVDVTLIYPQCGQRVLFRGVIQRGGFVYDLTGVKGTVHFVTPEVIRVKLDDDHPALAGWDNCIEWVQGDDTPHTPCRPQHVIFDFDVDVEYID